MKKNYKKKYTLTLKKDKQNDIIEFLENSGSTKTTIVNLIMEHLKRQVSK